MACLGTGSENHGSTTIGNSAAVAGLTPSGPGAQGVWRGNA
jgi:hypothetical protein